MRLLPTDPIERKSYIMGLQIAGDFGIVIALPIIIFVLIGRAIDAHYHTGLWGTGSAFVLAAILSGKILYGKAQYYSEQYKKLLVDSKPSPKIPLEHR